MDSTLRDRVVGAAIGASVGALAFGGLPASAHNINQGWSTVAQGGQGCTQNRAETDHDTANHHRSYWTTRFRTILASGSCGYAVSRAGRIKGEVFFAPTANGADGPYSLCLSTVGDGLGATGYYHFNGSSKGYNSVWRDAGACGTGHYRPKTWGHQQNNGWFGGPTLGGYHSFK